MKSSDFKKKPSEMPAPSLKIPPKTCHDNHSHKYRMHRNQLCATIHSPAHVAYQHFSKASQCGLTEIKRSGSEMKTKVSKPVNCKTKTCHFNDFINLQQMNVHNPTRNQLCTNTWASNH